MKKNLIPLLPLLAILAGGCTPTYHGPDYHGSPTYYPPGLWDPIVRGEATNGPAADAETGMEPTPAALAKISTPLVNPRMPMNGSTYASNQTK